jgi:hypothetical protein
VPPRLDPPLFETDRPTRREPTAAAQPQHRLEQVQQIIPRAIQERVELLELA